MGVLDLTGSGAKPLEPDDPRQIGGIPLAGRLGSGGMGRVYLGVHEGRYVAVKQVLPSIAGEDQDFVRRFGHELDNLSRLPAEATAPLIASDRDARPPWLATAYVPGLTLSEAIGLNKGPLPVGTLWFLLREAAAGLVAVHELDMVHRDLKPSNVMLTVDGATVIDFGVARATEQSQLTRSGMVVGTPAYMAPEQATTRRDLTGAADVFALGSVLAYAAGGSPPFGEESGPAVLYRIVHEEPDLDAVRRLDPGLADVVAACLAKDPADRPTAAELVRRATEHGPFTAPLWPESISGNLAGKAAFAAHVQEIELPPPASVATRNLGRKGRPKFRERRLPYARLLRRRTRRRDAGRRDPRRPAPALDLRRGRHRDRGPVRHGHGPGRAHGVLAERCRLSGLRRRRSRRRTSRRTRTTRRTGEGTRRRTGPRAPPRAPGTAGGAQDGSGGSDGSGAGGSSASGGSGSSGGADPGAPRHPPAPTAIATPRTASVSPPRTTATRPPVPATAPAPSGASGACPADPSSSSTSRAGRASAAGAGGVLLLSCNEDASRQWRAGSGGTFVSVGTGGCLGTGNGGGLLAGSCSGAAAQRWTAV